jgi:ribosomal protein S18 acetylase RimI-like enzyme
MVRLVETPDVPRLAEVLADAFVDDPLSKWLFNDDDGLRERLRRSFDALMRKVYLRKQHTYTTDDLAGCAMWAPPGKWKLSVIQQLRMAPVMMRLMSGTNLRNGARLNVQVEHAHPKDAHYHLSVLGVLPERQRGGVGSSLVSPILERADAERVLCHLETSKAENLAYYARFGFENNGELMLPPGAPSVWTMTRRPM